MACESIIQYNVGMWRGPGIGPKTKSSPSHKSAPSFDKTRKIFPTHQQYKSQFRRMEFVFGRKISQFLEYIKRKRRNRKYVNLCAVVLGLRRLISEYLHYQNYSVLLYARLHSYRYIKPFIILWPLLLDISIMIQRYFILASGTVAASMWTAFSTAWATTTTTTTKRQLNQQIRSENWYLREHRVAGSGAVLSVMSRQDFIDD